MPDANDKRSLAEAAKILHSLTDDQATIETSFGDVICFFCREEQSTHPDMPEKHAADCAHVRARAFLAEMEKQP